jgi:alkylglycerol monooxygenase
MSQITGLFVALFTRGHLHRGARAPGDLVDARSGLSWAVWLLALVFYDFCYYWLHRAGHRRWLFWAAHVVHHQSQDYNLSTALRQTSSGCGVRLDVLPADGGGRRAAAGVRRRALIDLLYQFWVHTEHVGKLGWFDRWFCSPSNHRVHHAVNERYLDRNYGGILVVWDRLFGSFQEEDERCIYGTRKPLNSWDPLWANAEVYATLLRDSWRTRHWGDKLRVWIKPPGWQPADLAAAEPAPPFQLDAVQTFGPPMSRVVQGFGVVQFALLLAGVAAFLWTADRLPLAQAAVWLAVLTASLWALGAVLQGRMGMLEALMIESAALATATSALGMIDLHRIFKPLTMVIAIIFIATYAASARAGGQNGSSTRLGDRWLVLAALLACLAGDVFLMFPGYFIPGLVAFLIGHLFYIAAFRLGVPWLPSRRALGMTLGIGGTMYTVLWFGGLPPALRIPVAAYVVVIALMAAQAIGRAAVLRPGPGGRAAMGVAVGAGFFMLSDSVLALNRFVAPLPMAQFWVLATYYTAQVLIVRNVLIDRNPA